jgi:hypothetical protein
LSTGVASSAVGVEDLFSVVNVCGDSGLDSKSESNGTSGDDLERNQNHHCKSDVNKIEKIISTKPIGNIFNPRRVSSCVGHAPRPTDEDRFPTISIIAITW